MRDTVAGIVVAGLSILAGIVLFNALRQIVRRGEWTSTVWLGVALTTLTYSFVELVVTYLNAWTRVTDVLGTVTYVVPEWAIYAIRVTQIVAAIAAIAIFAVRIRRRDAVLNVPALLLLLTMFVAMAVAVLQHQSPFLPQPIQYLCLVLAAVVAPRGLGIHIGIGAVCMVVAIGSGIAFVVHHDFSVLECTTEKCGILGFNFRGALDNENALALYLALAMPFVYIGFGGWRGLTLSGYLLVLVLMTGSRTGMTAALLTFCALALVRPTVRRPARTPVRSALLSIIIIAVFVVGFAAPFVTHDVNAFTDRAYIWEMTRNALHNSATLIHGSGLFGWDDLQASGLIGTRPIYSAHNQWLHVLFSTGLVGLFFFCAALMTLFWQARHRYAMVIGCVLLPLFVLAVTERPWTIGTIDWLTWHVPAALLCYPIIRSRVPAGRARTADGTADVAQSPANAGHPRVATPKEKA